MKYVNIIQNKKIDVLTMKKNEPEHNKSVKCKICSRNPSSHICKIFFWLRQNTWLIIGFIIILIIIFAEQETIQFEKSIALLLSLLAFFIGLNYNAFNKRKTFLDAFKYFNERYDKLNECMNKIKDGKTIENKNAYEVMLIVYDYLNLCAEEYYWYRQGLINQDVWYNWHNGMEYFFKCELVKIIVYEERHNKDSYYCFYETELIGNILKEFEDN